MGGLGPGAVEIVVCVGRHEAAESRATNPKWTGGDGLTGREIEVLQLVSEGRTTKEIASVLEVSAKTIDSHREHIMAKLGIHSIAGLTKYAVREGITPPQ